MVDVVTAQISLQQLFVEPLGLQRKAHFMGWYDSLFGKKAVKRQYDSLICKDNSYCSYGSVSFLLVCLMLTYVLKQMSNSENVNGDPCLGHQNMDYSSERKTWCSLRWEQAVS